MQSGLLKSVLKFLKGKGMNIILKQIVTMFLNPNTSELYLLGWRDYITDKPMRFDSACVEYYKGRGDAYSAFECLDQEVA